MKILIVFDSVHGNTETIAVALGEALSSAGEVEVVHPAELAADALESLDVLIVGSPTYGGRPIKAVNEFLDKIPGGGLNNISIAAFDTRISGQERGLGIRVLTGVLGYAAGRIAKRLQAKGGHSVVVPAGFIVEDTKGPLKAGELERAVDWAQEILKNM